MEWFDEYLARMGQQRVARDAPNWTDYARLFNRETEQAGFDDFRKTYDSGLNAVAVRLTRADIQALLDGKLLAIDVMGEYTQVVFVGED